MMVSTSFLHAGIFCSPPTTENYQWEIVKANGLNPLLRLLQSPYLDSISAAVSCVFNLTLRPASDSPIIEAGFLRPLVNLLAFKDSEEVQLNAAKVLGNFSASTEKNKWAIVNAGAVQSIKELVAEAPASIQIEMTRCIKNLSHSCMRSPFDSLLQSNRPLDEISGQLSEIGISKVLILLTNSPNSEVRRRSNAALRNIEEGEEAIIVIAT